MSMFYIALPVLLLVLPALYVICSRKSKGGSGGARPDATEPQEATGTEQAKHRQLP